MSTLNNTNYLTEEEIVNNIKKLNEYNSLDNLNVDMHNHTISSDGEDSPLYLMMRAKAKGLDVISITDHNKVTGYEILKNQIEKYITLFEEKLNNPHISEEEKQNLLTTATRLKNVLTSVKIIPGCEVLTTYKGCPYIEILAYGIDLKSFEEKLKSLASKVESPGKILYNGLVNVIEKNNLNVDPFYMKYNSNYVKLIYHELAKHEENKPFLSTLKGNTIEELEQDFEKKYLRNPKSPYYVDLDNQTTRKKELIKVFEASNLTLDINIIKNAGSTIGQFYNEFKKDKENQKYVKPEVTDLKKFIYQELYNHNSPFFIDLTSTKPAINDVLRIIKETGGISIVAHWGRYKKSNQEVFDCTLDEGFKNLTEIIDLTDGAECIYPDNDTKTRETIYRICQKKNKFISIGGDNHGKTGKEGKQYMLGSMQVKNLNELSWIKNFIDQNKDFITLLNNENNYLERLDYIINSLMPNEGLKL